jgi:hypothetical protein
VADFTIALEKADDEAFSVNEESRTFKVLVATNYKTPKEGPRIVYGGRAVNTTGFYRLISVTFEHFGVEAPGSYGQDFGDLSELESYLFAPHLRIIPTGTDLPRTNGTGDFWPDFLGDGYPVVRESYAPSPNAEAGADVVQVTFRAVEPNT